MAKTKELQVVKNLDRIKQWRSEGATHAQICKSLGVSRQSFYNYIAKNAEIADAVLQGEQRLAETLRGELARQAMPHEIKTVETVFDKDGNVAGRRETVKSVDGNIYAIDRLMRNVANNEWQGDWTIKEKELDLRRRVVESSCF